MNKKIADNGLAFFLGTILPWLPLAVSFAVTAPTADDLETTIINIVTYLTEISIGVALLMYIVAGFLYMSAAGDTTKIGMAKSIITFTTIGLIIILLGEAIVSIVYSLVPLTAHY
jgi:hypothetical protein